MKEPVKEEPSSPPNPTARPKGGGAHRSYLITKEESGMRLDRYLATREGLDSSRTYVKRLIEQGDVRINGEVPRPADKVKEGAQIDIHLPPPLPLEVQPEDIPLDIHFEDEHLIVVEKPVGMVVHPAPGHPTGTLVNALLYHCTDLSGIGGNLRPGIVHRIDRDTSGLLVVAKHDLSHRGLAELFKTRPKDALSRGYQAIVQGSFDEDKGTMDTFHARHPTNRMRYTSKVESDKRAITHFWVLERYRYASLIRCKLETGRTHQIRVHMADRQRNLIGDQLYKSKPPSFWPNFLKHFPRQALHAYMLAFRHPITHEFLEFTSELPEDMADLVARLRALSASS